MSSNNLIDVLNDAGYNLVSIVSDEWKCRIAHGSVQDIFSVLGLSFIELLEVVEVTDGLGLWRDQKEIKVRMRRK